MLICSFRQKIIQFYPLISGTSKVDTLYRALDLKLKDKNSWFNNPYLILVGRMFWMCLPAHHPVLDNLDTSGKTIFTNIHRWQKLSWVINRWWHRLRSVVYGHLFWFRSTNIVHLSNRNLYFYRFWCHYPLIIQLSKNNAKFN